MSRLRVGVVFGGRSGEHEVSLRSAASVMAALDRKKYQVVPIGIDRSGGWLISGDPLKTLTDRAIGGTTGDNLAVAEGAALLAMKGESPEVSSGGPLDVVFPVLHGPYGEDGTIQGLFEMARIPYVGSGVLGSAVCMDKAAMKALLTQAGLPIAPTRLVMRHEWLSDGAAVLRP